RSGRVADDGGFDRSPCGVPQGRSNPARAAGPTGGHGETEAPGQSPAGTALRPSSGSAAARAFHQSDIRHTGASSDRDGEVASRRNRVYSGTDSEASIPLSSTNAKKRRVEGRNSSSGIPLEQICKCTCICACTCTSWNGAISRGMPVALLLLTCVALPALVVAFVAYLALRGSRPRERADILRALAVFAAALLLRAAPGLPAS